MKFQNLKPIKEGSTGILDGRDSVVIPRGDEAVIDVTDCENIRLLIGSVIGYKGLSWLRSPLLKLAVWWILRHAGRLHPEPEQKDESFGNNTFEDI